MKLKNILVIVFLVLTFIPIVIVSLLLYQSGFGLAKESYTRNLVESITVQADYITQALENNMIMDSQFAGKARGMISDLTVSPEKRKEALLTAFQSYLEGSEDKIAVCMLLDRNDSPLYTIGEKTMITSVKEQLPDLPSFTAQTMIEFQNPKGEYSLGVITPILDSTKDYIGCLISVYNQSYIFKIISSYYEITDTSTYICRENGDIISSRGNLDNTQRESVREVLSTHRFTTMGTIGTQSGRSPVSGYYRNIYNSPWYLAGFVDHTQILAFTNQFVWVYILIIGGVFIADLLLSIYFSQRVVRPINNLIQIMDGYPDSLREPELQSQKQSGYYETRYLKDKFVCLMRTILLVQHNFEGVYQLYQSSTMDDTNIDIDVKNQVVHSNKETYEKLLHEVPVPVGACIVERFTRCFCEKDQAMLTAMFEYMRDEHLATMREAEIYSPYFHDKWFHTLVVPMYEDARLSRLFVQLRDITSFKKQELETRAQALRDPLTSLYNRSGFSGSVEPILSKSGSGTQHGLLFLDMNYFKMVNDNLGHSTGDDLLRSVGKVLTDTVAPEGIASRFGGDEFAVFLPNISEEELNAVKAKLNATLVYPYQTETHSFTISSSIGTILWNAASPQPLDQLLKDADASMYKAKREFKQNRDM